MRIDQIKKELRSLLAHARPLGQERREIEDAIARAVEAARLEGWFGDYLAVTFDTRSVNLLSDEELSRAAAFVAKCGPLATDVGERRAATVRWNPVPETVS